MTQNNQNNQNQSNTKEKKKKKNTILYIILAILLIAIIVALIFFFNSRKNTNNNTNNPTNVPGIEQNVNDGNVDNGDDEGEKEPSISMPGWGSITIKANTTSVVVDFFNPKENEGNYYMTFELLVDTGNGYESLYSSGLVEPGKHITNIELSKPLAPGEYDAIVHIQPYTMTENPQTTNNGDVKITLIVQE